MSIKNDRWIKEQAAKGMIKPFEPGLVRETEDGLGLISYGLSSYGYDIRLSSKDFRIFERSWQEILFPWVRRVVDPKDFNRNLLKIARLHRDEKGEYVILPAHSYGLGVAVEKLKIPPTVTVLCIGKSTYARCGVIANLTSGEAGWRGWLTLEFSNSSDRPVRLYLNEGCIQLHFFEGERCEVSYETRKGKYQDQEEQVTIARI